MSAARVVQEHRWEMGITREEFLRLLPAAVEGTPHRAVDDGVEGASSTCRWSLRVRASQPRRVASLALPALEVRLRIDAVDHAEAERFVRRFLLGFQRAGG